MNKPTTIMHHVKMTDEEIDTSIKIGKELRFSEFKRQFSRIADHYGLEKETLLKFYQLLLHGSPENDFRDLLQWVECQDFINRMIQQEKK